jgi:hypothetical protein
MPRLHAVNAPSHYPPRIHRVCGQSFADFRLNAHPRILPPPVILGERSIPAYRYLFQFSRAVTEAICSVVRANRPPSRPLRMKLEAKEPDFTRATILLGDSIAEQLIASSRRSRPRWTELFEPYSDEEIRELMFVSRTHNVASHPLVSGFLAAWAQNTTWGIQPPLYTDRVRLKVPEIHLSRLAQTSGVESFSLLLGVRADFCSATFYSGDDHQDVMLIVNCPAFLHIASDAHYQASFERTIASIIHHEMAHFRHRKGGPRAETFAHCRGIASVLAAAAELRSAQQLVELIETEYLEFAQNDEIKSLVLNGDKATWRLIRRWQSMFKAGRGSEQSRDSLPKP